MRDISEASELLVDLGFVALDQGVESMKGGGPLVAIVVLDDPSGERLLHRFVADRLEDQISQARQFLAEQKPLRGAVVYDGYLTVEGDRTDAVLCEFYEAGDDESYMLAQRYTPKKRLKSFATIGDAAFIGNAASLF